ncbi:MAG: cbb3-type cytochrome c oxidase N-terminal domain-containing protein [Myxococcota bacterium]
MSSKKHDELLDHEYDGIREFDNPIPMWWWGIWWGTMAFSVVYFSWYHVMGGTGVVASYEAEMEDWRKIQTERALAAAKDVSEDKLLANMKVDVEVAKGETKFQEVCAACHGSKGEGLVGPNLTDSHWLHADGSLMSIRQVIVDGVPEKGMPPWGKILTPDEMIDVVSFIGTLRWTHVEGKEPQGEEIQRPNAKALTETPVDPAG